MKAVTKNNPWGWQGQGKPLSPAAFSKPCVQCGHCCRTGVCAFGEWDQTLHQCAFLQTLGNGQFVCKLYKAIINRPTDDWAMNPSFGAGCCSSGNPARIKLEKDNAKEPPQA